MVKTRLPLDSRAIQPYEFLAIYHTCDRVSRNKYVCDKWKLYFRIRWETGIRPGEALNLRTEDVYFDRLRVYRLKKKGKVEDYVPIRRDLYLDIVNYINKYKVKGRLFPETIQGATYIWNKLKKMTGIRQHLTLHSFRHGFAYNYLEQAKGSAGEALAKLQRLLAHENITTTAQYTRPTFKKLKEEIDSIDFGIGGRSESKKTGRTNKAN